MIVVDKVRGFTLRQKREGRKLYQVGLNLRFGVAAYAEHKTYASLAAATKEAIKKEGMQDFFRVLTRKNVVYIHKVNRQAWLKAKYAAAKKWGFL